MLRPGCRSDRLLTRTLKEQKLIDAKIEDVQNVVFIAGISILSWFSLHIHMFSQTLPSIGDQ